MRLPFVAGIWSRIPVGSVENKVKYGIYRYPHYAYGVYWSGVLCQQLGMSRMTVAEFGVAGGRGLVALEQASIEIGAHLGIRIDVVGFDSGVGMPPPVDYRDLPHIWNEGFYRMDPDKLLPRLKGAKLVLGDVRETIREWARDQMESPLGFIAFDLDYYSSTVAAFSIFDGPQSAYLPRVHCYFDDLASNDLGCMNTYVGEHLAIQEFNDRHPDRKICPVEQLRNSRPRWEHWQERMCAFHDFSHPSYTQLILPSRMKTQMPL